MLGAGCGVWGVGSARQVDVRLSGKGDSNSHGAGPVRLDTMRGVGCGREHLAVRGRHHVAADLAHLGFGVWGLGFGVWGLGFRVWGLGFRVQSFGLGFGVWGVGCRA